MSDKQRKVMQLADAILGVVDSAPVLTRSDLQGVAEALAMQTVQELWQK